MELKLTSFEMACLPKEVSTKEKFLFTLLLRSLEKGDTALWRECSDERLLELTEGTKEDLPMIRSFFAENFQEESLRAFPKWSSMEEEIAGEIAARLFRLTTCRNIQEEERLNPEQKKAVENGLTSSLFFLTGGPGTGKTHTAGVLLKQKALNHPSFFRVVLLAPTGKAMKTLEKSIQRAMAGETGCVIEAMTIHAFLMKRVREKPLEADLVMVDEASMIDTKLMCDLLRAIGRKTHLLFLGDADQLPPVEPGAPFSDIVRVLEEQKLPFVARLVRCERTDSKEIIACARSVLMGERVDFGGFRKEIQLVSAASENSWQEAERRWLQEVFFPWTDKGLSLADAQRLIHERVLLTADKKSRLGSHLLTTRGESLLPLKNSRYIPLLVTKNAYDLGVMNGDMGVLEQAFPHPSVHFSGRALPLVLLERWEKAFALTVHKSQGSEFQEVHLLVPSNASLSRKMLYTAITRARHKVFLYGTEASIQQAIAFQEERMTSLPFFLKKALREHGVFE